MASGRTWQIVEHAAVAGAVGGVLTIFELYREHLPIGTTALNVIEVIGVMLVVAAGIAFFEWLLDRQPIALGVGRIDGHWIDAIYDADTLELVRGAVIRIASSRGGGFVLWGQSYDAPGVNVQVGPWGGHGGAAGSSTLTYYYRGREGPHERDDGVCYYEFSRSPGDDAGLTFDGRFWAFGLRKAFYVRGRKVKKCERRRFLVDEGATLLREYLATQPRRLAPPPARPEPAGDLA
jgi:hypothetical protein